MSYDLESVNILGMYIIKHKLYYDSRGSFYESFNKNDFDIAVGQSFDFVQDNHSISRHGVIRGLHYQIKKPQGKLVRVLEGRVLDVVVDIRKDSVTYGQIFSIELDSRHHESLWIPPGLAHGFQVLSDMAVFAYKTTEYRYADYERTLLWNDNNLNIKWRNSAEEPIVSDKDSRGHCFEDLSNE